MMTLDNNVARQTVNLDILILLVEEDPQFVSQSGQIARDLAYGSQMQIAAALVVGVYGQILVY